MSALEIAAKLSLLTGGTITILTVYRHHGMLEASLSMVRRDNPDPLDDVLRDHASGIAKSAKEHAQALGAKDPRAFVRNGPVARSILAFAKEHENDLIVLGSRGAGTVDQYLLGSVSHKVTSVAECPVLVV